MIFREMKKLHKKGYKNIAGVDEAGRGPLAGPVVACATKLKIKNEKGKITIKNLKLFKGIRDSKKLSAKQRGEWHKILISHPDLEWAVARVGEKIIDKINILEATKMAMRKAVMKLKVKPDFLIVDGNFILDSRLRGNDKKGSGDNNEKSIKQKSIIKADEKIFLCAAASIIAKVHRDRIMVKLHKKYPRYGFDRHKGYGTKEHLRALKKHGACEIHRKSFKPISRLI